MDSSSISTHNPEDWLLHTPSLTLDHHRSVRHLEAMVAILHRDLYSLLDSHTELQQRLWAYEQDVQAWHTLCHELNDSIAKVGDDHVHLRAMLVEQGRISFRLVKRTETLEKHIESLQDKVGVMRETIQDLINCNKQDYEALLEIKEKARIRQEQEEVRRGEASKNARHTGMR